MVVVMVVVTTIQYRPGQGGVADEDLAPALLLGHGQLQRLLLLPLRQPQPPVLAVILSR